MAKFKVGDKVRLKKTGQVGTITRVFTDWGLINYWVKGLPGGPTDSPLYAEDRLELANSRTLNAMTKDDEKKIEGVLRMYLNKPGDRIEFKVHEGMPNGMSRTTVAVHAAYQDGQRETPDYRIRAAKKAVMDRLMIPCVGDSVRVMSDGSFAGNLVFMNSRACNALKLEPFNPNSVRLGKSVWYKGREMTYKGKGGGKVHLVDLAGNRIDVPVFDRNLKMLADAYEYYHNDGVPMPNFRVCNSSNPVVRKAMNAVARNAKSIDKWEFDIMLRSRIGDNGKGAEDYMRQNREQIEKDIGKDGFRRLCSKFGNTLAYNA